MSKRLAHSLHNVIDSRSLSAKPVAKVALARPPKSLNQRLRNHWVHPNRLIRLSSTRVIVARDIRECYRETGTSFDRDHCPSAPLSPYESSARTYIRDFYYLSFRALEARFFRATIISRNRKNEEVSTYATRSIARMFGERNMRDYASD